MNIVIPDAATLSINNDIDFSIFDQYGDVRIFDLTSDDEIASRIKDADVVLCNKVPMTAQRMKKALNLKYIGLFSTGYNNIDLEYTKNAGITVCNAAHYSTDAVAQHVFSLIMHFYNRVSEYNDFVQDGGWIRSNIFSPFKSMNELNMKTIGIIGYGSIGNRVAQISKAFNMSVLVSSTHMGICKKGGINFVSTDELLEKSDIVTVHCPLTEDTCLMCNESFFKKMKSDAMFINTSRGGVVDEHALVDALKKGEISKAALDVVETEPMSEKSPLPGNENLIITPHAAWAPVETRKRLIEIVSNNLKKWVAGTPVNVIK